MTETISGLPALGAAVAAGDLFEITDVSDPTDSVNGTTKKATLTELLSTIQALVDTNTAKVTNATHTGDVSGSTALTAQPAIITGKSLVTVASGDAVLISDVSDSGNLKRVLISDFIRSAQTDVASAGFVLDEDNMASNDATKLATQQSIKAYVDALDTIAAGDRISISTGGGVATISVNASSPVIRTPTTLAQITSASATISHATPITLITANANYVMTAAPLISDGTDGETIQIINVDSVDRITLQDQAILASSNLRLATPQLELYPRSSVTLVYSSTVGDWVEVARSAPDYVRENLGPNHVRWHEAFASTSVTSGSIGALNWRSQVSGTGAAIVHGSSFGLGTVKTLQTGTTSTGRAALFIGALASEGAGLGGMVAGSQIGVIAWRGYHSALSTASQEYITRIGLLDEVDGTQPADGYYFEYDRLTAGNFWRIVTANNSTRTKTTTSVAPSAGGGVNQTLRIEYDPNAVRFYIDGVLVGTHTTNIYSSSRWATPVASIIKSAGTTNIGLDVSGCALDHRVGA